MKALRLIESEESSTMVLKPSIPSPHAPSKTMLLSWNQGNPSKICLFMLMNRFSSMEPGNMHFAHALDRTESTRFIGAMMPEQHGAAW